MAKVRQLLIGLASSSALYSGLVPALGLGEITLHSALSQPLDAEIELFDVGDLTAEDMRVRLAPADVFARSGVDRLYFFNDLRFTPLLRGGKSVIRVVSTQPVREPYLNFIVEVVRPSGQLYREYTVLLDPPSSAAYRSLAAPAAAPVVASVPRAVAVERARPAVLPAAQQGNSYSVVSGDSLWKIANRLIVEGGGQSSAAALMDDLYALNPQAFINGDSNRLRAGARLLLPDSLASPASAPLAQAVAEVASPAAVQAQTPPAGSVAQPLDPAAELLTQEQTRVEQELASQIAETLQLQQSLAELGIQVQQLQSQMEARDQQIAGLQAELAARRASAAASTAVAPPVAQPAPQVAQSGNHWLAIIAGLLTLLLAGVAGLLWRSRKTTPAAPAEPMRAAVMPAVPVATAVVAPAAAVALNVRDVPRSGPVWPAAGEDALQSANVYIAYGRLNEAASTLRKAWEAQPQRSDIGFRLLEVLALLGDAQGFVVEETRVRASGFTPARIDELKARHAELFSAPPASLLEDVVLELDEVAVPALEEAANDGQLNLDDLSLDADWDLVSPFAPSKGAEKAESSEAPAKRKTSDIFELSGSRDARSPFAETMLVEETSNDDWNADEFSAAFLEDLDPLATSRNTLSKLNMALAYIEQGSLDSACQILNEVIDEGDEEQKQEARQLLAKIA